MDINSIEWLRKAREVGATHFSDSGNFYKINLDGVYFERNCKWRKSHMKEVDIGAALAKIDFATLQAHEEASDNEVSVSNQTMDDHMLLTFHPIEQDPNGINQHSPGAKLDSGKCKAGILLDFSRALKAVADVGTFGANKYSRGGWQSVENAKERYTDSLARHLLEMNIGDGKDSETGMPHIWHAAWNILAIIELEERANDTPISN